MANNYYPYRGSLHLWRSIFKKPDELDGMASQQKPMFIITAMTFLKEKKTPVPGNARLCAKTKVQERERDDFGLLWLPSTNSKWSSTSML